LIKPVPTARAASTIIANRAWHRVRTLRRTILIGLAGLVALLVAAAAAVLLPELINGDDRLVLRSKQPYSAGPHYAFVSPWGAESNPLLRLWGRRADGIRINPATFPNKTRFTWRWPPFPPKSDAGVWGYNHIGYGFYDGGQPESPVPPRRVSELKVLTQSLAWSGNFARGESTVLTEFYLRSNPRESEAKLIEIGWLLHMSRESQAFVKGGRQLGAYVDPTGRHWRAALNGTYLTFSPANDGDVTEARIDMLHALRWLQAKKLVRGDEWLTGLAIGVEPIKGIGSVDLARWAVEFR
jgi:hypothetical protein